MKRYLAFALATLALTIALPASASAAVSFSFTEAAHAPSIISPGTINRGDEYVGYSVKLKNSGVDPTVASPPTQIAVGLPVGMKLAGGEGTGWSCNTTTAVCSSSSVVVGGSEFAPLKLEVWVFPEAPGAPLVTFGATGGGTGSEATAQDSFSFGPEAVFGLRNFKAASENESGVPYTPAGGHPFQASTAFGLAVHVSADKHERVVEHLRDAFVDPPAGFLGNPEAIRSICTVIQVREGICLEGAAVGGLKVEVPELFPAAAPIYRVVPEKGFVAAFASRVVETSPFVVVIRAKVRSNGDYGVSISAPLPPQGPELLRINFATLCGYGAHTAAGFYAPEFTGCKTPGTVGANPIPFLSNQTKCSGGEPVTKVTADSFQHPGSQNDEGFPVLSDSNWKVAEVKSPEITGCNQLEFEPSFEGRPTTSVADAPSGLNFHLHIPQEGLLDKDGFATAHLKDTTVVLPAGMAVNPSAANGLDACSSAQVGLRTPVGQLPAHFSGHPANCPAASKLGTVEISTPVLDKPLQGAIYLAKQFDNPFDSLLALYIAVDDPETGIVVKLAGQVELDPVSGQITTIFEENPQVPFEDLDLKVFEGPRASLRTPATCGPKSTAASFTPWSAPESGPPVNLQDSFAISTPAGAGACPTSIQALPNSPRLSAGTITPKAGSYSPFVMRLTRDDGSQELKGLNATLPPGLTGRLAGTPFCTEAQIAAAMARSKPGKGALELASPSCPAASEVGSIEVSAGAGPVPYRTSGRAYLAGPYKGAPVSLVAITPAVAGPFDLGVVVIRNPLYIDPVTTQVTVKSDPIPTILQGIPLDVRSVEVRITKDRFTLNPTSCEPFSIAVNALGLSSDAGLSSHFQVGECAALAFKPNLKLQLHGGTKRGDYQRLVASVTYPQGANYANVARAAVTLPHSSFLAQNHIRTICTRVQYAAHACPAGSIYGHVTATTPLLDAPLTGPVYLRSSSHPLPDLVLALRGPDWLPIEAEAVGRVDSKNGGIRNTFELVPDAPLSKVTISLQGGTKSLIVNSRNLCNGRQRATVRFSAQNGKTRNFRPVVGNDCGGRGKKHGK